MVSAEPSPSAPAARHRFCTAGKIDAGTVAGCARAEIGGHDDEHRCSAVAATRDAVLDVGQQPRLESGRREVTAAARPRPCRQVVDVGARRVVTDHDEHPRLAVLGARRERRGVEHPRDEVVRHRRRHERPARPLGVHDVEQVTHRPRSPTRRKLFTYQMRSAGCPVHVRNVSRSRRSRTSGVIAWNDVSGSSVSIS